MLDIDNLQYSSTGWDFPIVPNETESATFLSSYLTAKSGKMSLMYIANSAGTFLWKGDILPYTYYINGNRELSHVAIKLINKSNDIIKQKVKIPSDSKVKLMIEATSTNHSLTYNADGTPNNHLDLYIAGGICCNNANKEESQSHEYEFVGAINILDGVVISTHTFTNMTSTTITKASDGTKTTYTQDETNLLYILESLLKTTGTKTSVVDDCWFSRIKILDKTLLQNSYIGCNKTFNQDTLLNVIQEIGIMINRIPHLYFNKDYDASATDHFTNENNREFLLKFEDITQGEIISWDTFKTSLESATISQDASKTFGNLVCEVQNVKSNDAIWYPGENSWCSLSGADNEIDFSYDSATLKVPENIQKVLTVKVAFYDYDSTNFSQGAPKKYRTIINDVPIIEKREWVQLNATEQAKTLYYEEGKNEIFNFNNTVILNLGSSMNATDYASYKNGTTRFIDLGFCVKYIPFLEAKFIARSKNGKKQKIYSQPSSVIDPKFLGDYLQNWAKESSNETISVPAHIIQLSDLKKVGTKIKSNNGNIYVISSIVLGVTNGQYQVAYTLNKDVVQRSSMIDTSDLADNKLIDTEKAQNRLETICDKAFKVQLSINRNIEECKTGYYNDERAYVLNGFMKNKALADNMLCYFEYAGSTPSYANNYYLMPVSRLQMGNSVLFNIHTKNNIWLQHYADYEFGSSSCQNKFKRYANPFGKVEKISMWIPTADSPAITNYGVPSTNVDYSYTSAGTGNILASTIGPKIKTAVDNFGNVSAEQLSDFSDSTLPIKIESYYLLKDTNERLNVSIQFDFIEKDTYTFITDKFVENTFVIKSLVNRSYFLLWRKTTSNYASKGEIWNASDVEKANLCNFTSVDNSTMNAKITFNPGATLIGPQNGRQIAIGLLRTDGKYDILVSTILHDLTQEQISAFANYYIEITTE